MPINWHCHDNTSNVFKTVFSNAFSCWIIFSLAQLIMVLLSPSVLVSSGDLPFLFGLLPVRIIQHFLSVDQMARFFSHSQSIRNVSHCCVFQLWFKTTVFQFKPSYILQDGYIPVFCSHLATTLVPWKAFSSTYNDMSMPLTSIASWTATGQNLPIAIDPKVIH